jgi:hypothetical protein
VNRLEEFEHARLRRFYGAELRGAGYERVRHPATFNLNRHTND